MDDWIEWAFRAPPNDPCDEWPAFMFGWPHPWDVARAHLEFAPWRGGIGAPTAKAWDLGRYRK